MIYVDLREFIVVLHTLHEVSGRVQTSSGSAALTQVSAVLLLKWNRECARNLLTLSDMDKGTREGVNRH
jgi:hypothetical protein